MLAQNKTRLIGYYLHTLRRNGLIVGKESHPQCGPVVDLIGSAAPQAIVNRFIKTVLGINGRRGGLGPGRVGACLHMGKDITLREEFLVAAGTLEQ